MRRRWCQDPGRTIYLNMLHFSLWLLAAAALAGLVLIGLAQWRPAGGGWLPAAAHGLLGAAGFSGLLLSLGGPPRGVATGAQNFGAIAAGLVGFALALGLLIYAIRRRRGNLSPLLLGLHATAAVAGVVMLAAYLSLG